MLLTLYLNITFAFELEFKRIIKSHRGKGNIETTRKNNKKKLSA